MNFITIDFETAKGARNTPCEIGITIVRDGEISDTKSYLIKPNCYPDFDYYNIETHGIRPSDVQDAPEFPVVWEEISALLENNFVLAHYASFDLSVLKSTLEYYNLPFPSIDFSCTYLLTKKVHPEIGIYRLEYLSNLFQLGGDDHHRAGVDSLKAARLALKLITKTETNGIRGLLEHAYISHGSLSNSTYRSSASIRQYLSNKDKYGLNTIVSDPTNHNPESIFYQKEVVFTGALDSMPRKDAIKTVADLGGYPGDVLRTSTNFLVCGRRNMETITPDKMTGKFKKAVGFAGKGYDIEIIDENTFFQNL